MYPSTHACGGALLQFLCGVAPLITGDTKEKVGFAHELYDVDGVGIVKKPEMTFILRAMNDTASYFGDPVMSQDQIQVLIDEIFEKFDDEENPQGINYKECMTAIVQHPVLVSFVKGEGPVRYGQAK